MALTVANIQERVRDRYQIAENDEFFSDRFLRGLIFSAQEELAKEGYVIEKTLTTTSEAGTRTLTYPTNVLAIKEIKYDYVPLTKVPLLKDPKTDSTDPTGKPYMYGLWENQIILYPTPDTDGETIQIRVYKYPSDIATNLTAIEVPDEYIDDLIDFCLAHIALKDQNLNLYQIYIAQWRMTVEKAKEDRQKRLRADRSAKVRDTYWGSSVPLVYRNGVFSGFTI